MCDFRSMSLAPAILFGCAVLVTAFGPTGMAQAESPDSPTVETPSQPPNVLFIAIDDMNDWVGFLDGHPQAKTPNLDRLAKRSVNFTNAHCSAPACSPSRLSLLFGVQPFRSGLYPFYNHQKIAAKVLRKYTSLPALFRKQGYQAFGAGKIFHGYQGLGNHWDDYHKPQAAKLNYSPELGYQIKQSRKMAFCPTTNPLSDHPDYQVADYGIDVIERSHDQPFFLAVGIVKPHLPFVCPKQFFDMQERNLEKPRIRYKDLADVPDVGRSMASLKDDLKFRNDEAWGRVRRAYLACNSWVDFNIGRILDALENSEHAENTIIVLWSDHGYHFGEKRSFRKFSLWEEATHVPFIIHDPRPGRMRAGSCDQAVSLIHVYKTVCELAGVEPPDYVDGVSLVDQLNNPSAAVKPPAITTWGRGNYSVRGDRFRLTRYYDGTEELYDHQSDPMEWNNLAADPELGSTKARLAKWLPEQEAPLVRTGLALWNVNDADRPDRMDRFRKETWPQMKRQLKPAIE